ncbi:MAG: hypothetical protein LBT87_09490, partial [Treponema sp.]|nr:hypothetical protein [Treponema sp.]
MVAEGTGDFYDNLRITTSNANGANLKNCLALKGTGRIESSGNIPAATPWADANFTQDSHIMAGGIVTLNNVASPVAGHGTD